MQTSNICYLVLKANISFLLPKDLIFIFGVIYYLSAYAVCVYVHPEAYAGAHGGKKRVRLWVTMCGLGTEPMASTRTLSHRSCPLTNSYSLICKFYYGAYIQNIHFHNILGSLPTLLSNLYIFRALLDKFQLLNFTLITI